MLADIDPVQFAALSDRLHRHHRRRLPARRHRIAQVAFTDAGERQPDRADGKAVGSALIGQPFSDPKYFWGRPSATSPMPYNARRLERLEPGPAQSRR